jgi:hypothetical protein
MEKQMIKQNNMKTKKQLWHEVCFYVSCNKIKYIYHRLYSSLYCKGWRYSVSRGFIIICLVIIAKLIQKSIWLLYHRSWVPALDIVPLLLYKYQIITLYLYRTF